MQQGGPTIGGPTIGGPTIGGSTIGGPTIAPDAGYIVVEGMGGGGEGEGLEINLPSKVIHSVLPLSKAAHIDFQ
jgi:hypothetical protein